MNIPEQLKQAMEMINAERKSRVIIQPIEIIVAADEIIDKKFKESWEDT